MKMLATLLLGTALGAAAQERRDAAPDTKAARESAAPVPERARMGAAEILAFIRTVNDAELEAARAVSKKARDERAKSFAIMMLGDHKKSNDALKEFAAVEKIEPLEGPSAREFRAAAQKQSAELMKQKGAAFDRMYIDQQVDGHAQVLDTLDRALRQSEDRSPQLQAFLTKTRETVAGHLKHAKELQREWREGAGG